MALLNHQSQVIKMKLVNRAKKGTFEEEFYSTVCKKLHKEFTKSALVAPATEIIKFPILFFWFSQKYKFDKRLVRLILHELDKRKLVKIVNYHGIKLLK